ncbi:MAG: hypothetical protein WDN48_02980 [Pseudolabrys sp.]
MRLLWQHSPGCLARSQCSPRKTVPQRLLWPGYGYYGGGYGYAPGYRYGGWHHHRHWR